MNKLAIIYYFLNLINMDNTILELKNIYLLFTETTGFLRYSPHLYTLSLTKNDI